MIASRALRRAAWPCARTPPEACHSSIPTTPLFIDDRQADTIPVNFLEYEAFGDIYRQSTKRKHKAVWA